jgi:thiamine transport system permease protein
MLTLATRILRCLGWAVVIISMGVVVGEVAYESVRGPETGQSLWPTPRMWRCYGTTLWMAASATVIALLLALPAAFALVATARKWQRSLLSSLTIIPLLTMPSIFAYAWMLVATSPNAAVARIVQAVGWNTPGAEPLQAAWVLATWLWPIPALILAVSFKHLGARAYQLACLDASSGRAFVCGALPVMRAPVVAALSVVFILSLIDSTVAPLMNATQVWSVEMLANAAIARSYSRPAGFLFWQTWPMLCTIAILAAAAIPGLRQMAGWADEPDTADTGTAVSARPVLWASACLIAAGITVFPIVVFAVDLAGGRTTPIQAFATAWRTCGSAATATLIVGGLAGLGSTALAVALMDDPAWSRARRFLAGAVSAVAIAVAVFPPELSATALAAFFSDGRISPPERWNLYDNTPFVWMATMVARFGFVPVCVARLLNRRVPADLTALATTDGADRIQSIAHARLAVLWRGLAAAGMMVACLTISEAAASVLVQPAQFFGGSLAVHVDSQMHYGRQSVTVAMSLMLIIPAVLIAGAAPVLTRLPSVIRPRADIQA